MENAKFKFFPIILVLNIFSFFLEQTNHNLPELVNGIILSEISAKKQCPNATVVLIPLLPCSKKDLIRRGNINITDGLLEEKSRKHGLSFFEI